MDSCCLAIDFSEGLVNAPWFKWCETYQSVILALYMLWYYHNMIVFWLVVKQLEKNTLTFPVIESFNVFKSLSVKWQGVISAGRPILRNWLWACLVSAFILLWTSYCPPQLPQPPLRPQWRERFKFLQKTQQLLLLQNVACPIFSMTLVSPYR